MKQCLRIILVASLAFAVSTADAQTKLKPDGKALRTNTISVYGQGGATWVTGLHFKSINPSTGTETSPMVGAGGNYNFRPWIRMGLNYKFATYKREQRYKSFAPQGTAQRGEGVNANATELEKSTGGLAYANKHFMYHSVDLTGELNILELFWSKRENRRFNLYLGTGIGLMWSSGNNYDLTMGVNTWKDPSNVVNGKQVKNNVSTEAYVRAGNLRDSYNTLYVPSVLCLEYDIIPQLTIGVKGGCDFLLQRRSERFNDGIQAGLTLRYNIVGKKHGVRSYEPLYRETYEELNRMKAAYEKCVEDSKKENPVENIAKELREIKEILQQNNIEKKAEAPALTVYFSVNATKISDTERERLLDFTRTLGPQESVYLDLVGEASAEGNSAHNQWLSEVRLGNVKTFLVQNGISPARIVSAKAIGDSMKGGPSHRRVVIETKNN